MASGSLVRVDAAGRRRSPATMPGLSRAGAPRTSTYLQGIDPSEIIDAVRSRRQPTISAAAGLTL
jgi:hypothetical protein